MSRSPNMDRRVLWVKDKAIPAGIARSHLTFFFYQQATATRGYFMPRKIQYFNGIDSLLG